MLNFLTENWKFIVMIGSIIIELVLILVFKKRPEVIDNSLVMRLALWIDYAEKHFVLGSDKMQYVLEQAQKYLGDRFNKKSVQDMVEYILTLPEKKEK